MPGWPSPWVVMPPARLPIAALIVAAQVVHGDACGRTVTVQGAAAR
jgi:hypothetical protein